MEAEAIRGLGAAFAGSGFLLLLTAWLKIETPRGKRLGWAFGLGQIVLGAALAAGATLVLLA